MSGCSCGPVCGAQINVRFLQEHCRILTHTRNVPWASSSVLEYTRNCCLCHRTVVYVASKRIWYFLTSCAVPWQCQKAEVRRRCALFSLIPQSFCLTFIVGKEFVFAFGKQKCTILKCSCCLQACTCVRTVCGVCRCNRPCQRRVICVQVKLRCLALVSFAGHGVSVVIWFIFDRW